MSAATGGTIAPGYRGLTAAHLGYARCGSNVSKISPTQFQMKATDFMPDGDLHILILSKIPAQ